MLATLHGAFADIEVLGDFGDCEALFEIELEDLTQFFGEGIYCLKEIGERLLFDEVKLEVFTCFGGDVERLVGIIEACLFVAQEGDDAIVQRGIKH